MKTGALLISLLLIASSCIEKDPSWAFSWPSEPSGGENKETPKPEPPGPPEPPQDTTMTPTDTSLLRAFSQDFKTADTAPFVMRTRSGRDDFRYFPGFPSLSEVNTDILMLRLDPADASAAGPRLDSDGICFFGSYSLRVRTPDLSRVRKTTDAAIEFCLVETGKSSNACSIRMKWALSSPGNLTLNSRTVAISASQNPSAQFQTLGWDWTPDSVKWWILNPSTKEKTIIGEITAKDEIPTSPGILSLGLYHSSDAPEYPFETEIDRISYDPFDDIIKTWTNRE